MGGRVSPTPPDGPEPLEDPQPTGVPHAPEPAHAPEPTQASEPGAGNDTTAQDAALRVLLDEERGRAAAAERARTRHLREQAGEEGTLVGTLLDLSEQGSVVTLRVSGGRRHQGVIAGVGADYCALRTPAGPPVYVALAAIGTVRPAPGASGGDLGRRERGADRTLAEALGRLAPERPRVALQLAADADPVRGELRTVGRDVAEVRMDGPGRPRCYVRLAAVHEVVVDPE